MEVEKVSNRSRNISISIPITYSRIAQRNIHKKVNVGLINVG